MVFQPGKREFHRRGARVGFRVAWLLPDRGGRGKGRAPGRRRENPVPRRIGRFAIAENSLTLAPGRPSGASADRSRGFQT
ncbi:hypothetical protein Ga0080574_TMP1788 [Salipiger abyssi]|uniref:Uncharacterized protein n=1 Tax=Salipiger abyssi TaxID=1250539 RepID=A0A1P8URS6_9RHOB|nr:hypothetical protein Ga0080574_TMP1788 [Salipiger abyssi]